MAQRCSPHSPRRRRHDDRHRGARRCRERQNPHHTHRHRLRVVAGVRAVVFAITQNALWIAIGIPFGAAFGIVFGRYLRRMDDNFPLVAIFGPFLIHGHRRDRD